MLSASSSQPRATSVWGFYFPSTGVGSPEVRDAKPRSLLAGECLLCLLFPSCYAGSNISTMGPVVGCTAELPRRSGCKPGS